MDSFNYLVYNSISNEGKKCLNKYCKFCQNTRDYVLNL
jgi:hypothetical protein